MIQSMFLCTHTACFGVQRVSVRYIYIEIYGYKHTIFYIYIAKVCK